MGAPKLPADRDTVLAAHVASMRSYADTLMDWWPFISRRKVVERVRKCAGDVERAYALGKKNEFVRDTLRQGQSPNGGDGTKIAAPALLTGPVPNGETPNA